MKTYFQVEQIASGIGPGWGCGKKETWDCAHGYVPDCYCRNSIGIEVGRQCDQDVDKPCQ